MYLRKQISCVSFFQRIDACTGTVVLHTTEGDVLNLRSQLCRYVFAVTLTKPDLLKNATVECQYPEDYALLREFLSDDQEEV